MPIQVSPASNTKHLKELDLCYQSRLILINTQQYKHLIDMSLLNATVCGQLKLRVLNIKTILERLLYNLK